MNKRTLVVSLLVFCGVLFIPGIALAAGGFRQTVNPIVMAVGAINIVLAIGAAFLSRGGMLGELSLWVLIGTLLASAHRLTPGIKALNAAGEIAVGFAVIFFIIGAYRLTKFLKELTA